MLAKNPLTGEPINILQSDASIWRNQKTLVWLSPEEASIESARWNRWEVGATSIADAKALEAVGVKPDVVLCLGSDVETLCAWFEAGSWRPYSMTAVPKSFLEAVGYEKVVGFDTTNMVCLDDIAGLYPFVGGAWDGSVEDAKLLIALLLKQSRTFPVTSSRLVPEGLVCSETLLRPPPLWFLTQTYKPSKPRRAKELTKCLEENLENPFIDRVVLLNESPMEHRAHPKLEEHIVGKRLTYADVIRWIAESPSVPEDAIIVFANADIYLEKESWKTLWSTSIKDVFLALLRWDVDEYGGDPQLFGPRADSQDTWVLDAASVRARTWDSKTLEFPFGKAGCDNSIAIEMMRQRFLVVNPALTLRTFHMHASELRDYDPRDIVKKPTYLYIQPSGIHDLKPVLTLESSLIHTTVVHAPVSRAIRGSLTKSQAATFATMLAKGTGVELDSDRPVQWTPPATPLYKYNNVFQSREGLVFTYNSILVGPTKGSKEAWAASELSTVSPSIPVELALVAPLPDLVAKDPARYTLQYLSKVMLLKEQFPAGEFFCSKEPALVDVLKLFDWGKTQIPVICRDTSPQAWCKEAIVWNYPEDAGSKAPHTTKEEVDALRRWVRGWLPSQEAEAKKRYVVIVDGTWITDAMVEKLEEGGFCDLDVVWSSRTTLETLCRLLRGASGLISVAGDPFAAWSWLLPKEATVVEFQSEMAPNPEGLHLAAVAGLHHSLAILPKGAPNHAEIVATLRGLLPSNASALPLIRVPCKTSGLFAHSGDSFREMLRIWEARGYCKLEGSPDLCQIWMGDVLLYDRPTLDWLRQAPAAEAAWRKALFGNPKPLEGELAWSFWPRRPELVEALVTQGVPQASYESRQRTLVFYGRSENVKQKLNRTGQTWGKACDEFVHLDGMADYVYSQEEYLRRLAGSRFGLCLAGFGAKCHREIECMAMGCVPVVAPEVDMTSYANPPVEGTHYFRVKTPAEATRIVREVTPEKWCSMSEACKAWWFQNASADGLWALTQRLAAANP